MQIRGSFARPSPANRGRLRAIFQGSAGIRAGWRVLLYGLIAAALVIGLRYAALHSPIRRLLSALPREGIRPAQVLITEGLLFGTAAVATAIMASSKIGRSRASDCATGGGYPASASA